MSKYWYPNDYCTTWTFTTITISLLQCTQKYWPSPKHLFTLAARCWYIKWPKFVQMSQKWFLVRFRSCLIVGTTRQTLDRRLPNWRRISEVCWRRSTRTFTSNNVDNSTETLPNCEDRSSNRPRRTSRTGTTWPWCRRPIISNLKIYLSTKIY